MDEKKRPGVQKLSEDELDHITGGGLSPDEMAELVGIKANPYNDYMLGPFSRLKADYGEPNSSYYEVEGWNGRQVGYYYYNEFTVKTTVMNNVEEIIDIY